LSFSTTAITRVALLPLILAVSAGASLRAAEPPQGVDVPVNGPKAAVESPTYVILNNPTDLTGILKGMPPGSMIVKADPSREPAESKRLNPSGGPLSHVVRSVKISGQIVDERAELDIELEINLREDRPVWVPIRLDGKVLFAVREGGRDLFRRCLNEKQWEVQLEHKGLHRIHVELKVVLKSILDRNVLELDIPNAATTSIELDVPQRVVDASAGLYEPVGQISLGASKGYRLTAHLPPRSKLELSWRKDSGADSERQALLSVQGEIAVDAELESLKTRSTWLVRCVRGSARILEVTLDNQDEVLEVLLDDQVIRYETERVGRATLLKIPLAEPILPGGTRRIVFSTRRAIPASESAAVSFRGFAFSRAKDQSGAIALFPGVNLWANFQLGHGVLQINASEMPADLRARPGTPLAFQFLDQPFEIKLSIESSPPLANAETRTVLRLGPDVVNQETWVDLQLIRGRLFDIQIAIPDGLQLTACGPAALIEPANQSNNASLERSVGEANATKILKIRLTPQAMDQKKITIKLEGYQRYKPAEITRIGLLQPRNMIEISSRFAIVASRDLSVEAGEEITSSESDVEHRFTTEESPTDWPWPGTSAETKPSRFLTSQGLPRVLPLRITRNPRTMTQDVSISVRLTRGGALVQQQTDCEVRHGAARTVEVVVPAGIGEDWEAFAPDGMKREEIERFKDGERRFRLILPNSAAERFTLRFRYPIVFGSELDAKTRVQATVPWIEVGSAAVRGVQVEFSCDAGVHVVSKSPGWSSLNPDRTADASRGTTKISSIYRLDQPNASNTPFHLTAWASEQARLPRTLSPRMVIRTTYGFDRLLHSSAWILIEKHANPLAFELPIASRLIKVVLDGRVLAPEEIESDDSHRICKIEVANGRESRPNLLEIEYDSAGDSAGGEWQAPRLLDDAIVLETFWQIVLPWNMALVGAPAGWSDDNQWFWDSWSWRRRPARGVAGLLGRLGVNASGVASRVDESQENGVDSHGYLFSRTGEIGPMRVWVIARPLLIGACSGLTLLVGFALMLLPKSKARILLGLLAFLGLMAAAFVHPSSLILAVQSSIIGIVLSLMGFAIQHLIEVRHPMHKLERDPGRTPIPFAAGSSMTRQPESGTSGVDQVNVGSDESTAIRVRVASTAEYRAKESVPEPSDRAPGSKIELVR